VNVNGIRKVESLNRKGSSQNSPMQPTHVLSPEFISYIQSSSKSIHPDVPHQSLACQFMSQAPCRIKECRAQYVFPFIVASVLLSSRLFFPYASEAIMVQAESPSLSLICLNSSWSSLLTGTPSTRLTFLPSLKIVHPPAIATIQATEMSSPTTHPGRW